MSMSEPDARTAYGYRQPTLLGQRWSRSQYSPNLIVYADRLNLEFSRGRTTFFGGAGRKILNLEFLESVDLFFLEPAAGRRLKKI